MFNFYVCLQLYLTKLAQYIRDIVDFHRPNMCGKSGSLLSFQLEIFFLKTHVNFFILKFKDV